MNHDRLLTDDLTELFALFPSDSLKAILTILKANTSYSPFPQRRAVAARTALPDADLRLHAADLATEILWWGDSDIRLPGSAPTWPRIIAALAEHVGVEKEKASPEQPAWRIEAALMAKVLADWEDLDPEEREAAMTKSGGNFAAAVGASAAAVGGVMASVGPLAAFLAARAAPAAAGVVVAAPVAAVLAPLLTFGGALYAAYSLGGPAYRVLQPVSVVVAITRQSLREEAIRKALED